MVKGDADIKILSDESNQSISVKSNATFSKYPQITFRGEDYTGGIPEIDSVKKNKSVSAHILFYNKDKYLSLASTINNKECIKKEFYLGPSNKWGGSGAYRILFQDNILDYASHY